MKSKNCLLAIDTTLLVASTSIYNEKENYVLTEKDDSLITHSEKVLPLIHNTLIKANLNIKDITMLGVINGPRIIYRK